MRYIHSMILAVAVLFTANGAMADTFGTGDNQFTIDFVPISGDEPDRHQPIWRLRHRRQRLPHGHLRDHQRPVEQVQG